MGAFLALTYKMDGDSLIMIMPEAEEIKKKAVIHDTIMILSGRGPEWKLIRVAGNAKGEKFSASSRKELTLIGALIESSIAFSYIRQLT